MPIAMQEKGNRVSELEEVTGLCVASFVERLLKGISPHTRTREGSIALRGKKNVFEVETDVPIAKREKFMSEWARGGHGILRHSLGTESLLNGIFPPT